jgi:hypothetical protein
MEHGLHLSCSNSSGSFGTRNCEIQEYGSHLATFALLLAPRSAAPPACHATIAHSTHHGRGPRTRCADHERRRWTHATLSYGRPYSCTRNLGRCCFWASGLEPACLTRGTVDPHSERGISNCGKRQHTRWCLMHLFYCDWKAVQRRRMPWAHVGRLGHAWDGRVPAVVYLLTRTSDVNSILSL